MDRALILQHQDFTIITSCYGPRSWGFRIMAPTENKERETIMIAKGYKSEGAALQAGIDWLMENT